MREVLAPEPARVDPDAAWAALARDKKAERGAPRLVLLDALGQATLGGRAARGRRPARARGAHRVTGQ